MLPRRGRKKDGEEGLAAHNFGLCGWCPALLRQQVDRPSAASNAANLQRTVWLVSRLASTTSRPSVCCIECGEVSSVAATASNATILQRTSSNCATAVWSRMEERRKRRSCRVAVPPCFDNKSTAICCMNAANLQGTASNCAAADLVEDG